jgi:glycyl-tRNA synthetase beta chain
MAELLVELRADAFDAATLPSCLLALKEALVEELSAAGMAPRQAATAATARRLVVLLRGVPATVPEPRAQDSATSAPARERARDAVQRALETCRFPRTGEPAALARWHGTLRGLLVLFDGAPLEVTMGTLVSRPESVGHPTLSPAPIPVTAVEQYRAELLRRGIEVRLPERRRLLRDRLFAAAAAAGGDLVEDAALLDLVTAGCEQPGVVIGELEPEHLGLPRELVATALRERLQAFLLTAAGRPLARFLAVIDRPDDPGGGAARGVSWSASALLHDLAFHRQRDRRVPLAQRARELEDAPWRPGLGTFGQRTERLVALVRELGHEWGWLDDLDRASEAARLLHADAATALGRALPGLRGVIAGLLAREDGYPDSVWQAIYDHDRPATGKSLMPRGRCGTLVAFVHWTDALAGAALLGELGEPEALPHEVATTASGAERWRAARAILRVAFQRGLPVDLRLLGAQALRAYGAQGFPSEAALPALVKLLEAAAGSLLREDGFAEEEIAAVLLASASSQLGDVQARLKALRELCRDPELQPRLEPLVRTARTLEAMLRDTPEERLDVRFLATDEEKDVFVALQAVSRRAASLVDAGRPEGWLERMTALDSALQRLLRNVLVRDEDQLLRRNRVALVQEARRMYTGQVRLAELAAAGAEADGERGATRKLTKLDANVTATRPRGT